MKKHVDWPEQEDRWPVFIEVGLSVEEILEPANIRVHLKEPNINAIGFMIDADTNPNSRYQRLVTVCSDFFPMMPSTLDPDGLVIENADGQRLGIWIMPDNRSHGGLETFLRVLVPSECEQVWSHAVEATSSSRQIGAPFRDAHEMKAQLYTWLSWQDPPGQSPGLALTKKILSPHVPAAKPFVRWCQRLYHLESYDETATKADSHSA